MSHDPSVPNFLGPLLKLRLAITTLQKKWPQRAALLGFQPCYCLTKLLSILYVSYVQNQYPMDDIATPTARLQCSLTHFRHQGIEFCVLM